MNSLIVLPILLPLLVGAACVVAWRYVAAQRILTLAGSIVYLAVSVVLLERVASEGIQAVQKGDWMAPFGITLVADMFSAAMVATTGVVTLVIVVYSLGSMDRPREAWGYYPLFNILIMGVSGAFLTGDIFNLFVWFEVLLISSFVLLALGGERAQLEGAIKYVTLNLVASAFFLAAVGILYAMAGSLNMADLSVRLGDVAQPGLVTTLAILFLVAFGIKGAIFPLFFWLPASYHTPPVAISGIFGGLLTKVGVYALIRVFTLLFLNNVDYTHTIILWVGAITMVTGVLGAVAQYEFRRLLSFHIVSQIGYMVMGLGFFTPLALSGTVFFIVHNIFVKTNLFLVSGVSHRIHGTYDLKKLGGLYRAHPWVGMLFLLSALSLAGVPPLSGFFGKLVLVKAGLGIEQFVVVAAALGVSLLTLFSMTKIWAEAFWKPLPEGTETHAPGAGMGLMLGGIVTLAVLAVVMGVAAGPFFTLAQQAGEQLTNPAPYIEAVLRVRGGS
ncbi:MAG: Na+/H+ antiporter subunit D [Deltaproteobacteria bacterium]|nr:Na+/H+ antiporter subunit D [Deltaproteobacteria bacterium]